MDNHNIKDIEDLKKKISGMIREFNNLSPSQKKTASSAYNCLIKQYELMLKTLNAEFAMSNDEEKQNLIREFRKLKKGA